LLIVSAQRRKDEKREKERGGERRGYTYHSINLFGFRKIEENSRKRGGGEKREHFQI